MCLLEKRQDLSRVSPVMGPGRWQVASLKLMWSDGVLVRCTTAWWDGVLFSQQPCLLSSTQPIKAAQQPGYPSVLGYFCSLSTHLTPALTFSPIPQYMFFFFLLFSHKVPSAAPVWRTLGLVPWPSSVVWWWPAAWCSVPLLQTWSFSSSPMALWSVRKTLDGNLMTKTQACRINATNTLRNFFLEWKKWWKSSGQDGVTL